MNSSNKELKAQLANVYSELMGTEHYRDVLITKLAAAEKELREAKSWRVFAWADGVAQWAWWKDGVQYVGTCGTTLEDALERNPYREETE